MDVRIIVMIVAAASFIGATWLGFHGSHDKSHMKIGVILVGFGTILPVVAALILS